MKQVNPSLSLLVCSLLLMLLARPTFSQEKTPAEHLQQSQNLITLEVIPKSRQIKVSLAGRDLKISHSFLMNDPRPATNQIVLQIKEAGEIREVIVPLTKP